VQFVAPFFWCLSRFKEAMVLHSHLIVKERQSNDLLITYRKRMGKWLGKSLHTKKRLKTQLS